MGTGAWFIDDYVMRDLTKSAINIADPAWPKTLRGEAAELYLRWEHDLRPRGFHLSAQILEFPGGMPGDVGLFLLWGE